MAPQDFVDDDFYDPDEDDYEEELSSEDKAAMESGTIAVRKALGDDASKVTLDQIQEALWHYYYDVEKSVGYLRNKFVAPPPKPAPKKAAPEGKSTEFSFASTSEPFPRAGAQSPKTCNGWWLQPLSMNKTIHPTCCGPREGHTSMQDFFSDMPWLNVPHHRKATLLPPVLPRGGLLGGSEGAPKMSKLQALAAARKKKTSEKKESEKAIEAEDGLKNLSIAERTKQSNATAPSKSPSRLDTTPKQAATQSESSTTKEGEATHSTTQSSQHPIDTQASAEAQRTSPSAFARTLLGSAPGDQGPRSQDVFAMPYTSSSTFFAGAFTQPSPDDIVFAAQAKAGKKTAATAKPTKKAQKEGSSKDGSDTGDLSNSVNSLKVSDVPPPKSKGLDVLKEFEKSNAKRSTSFVVVGHVDAGKSTLMGRLLVELKYVEQRTVDKYRRQAEKSGKQSFALAWVMDQRSEERERGVTIDIATNYFETDQTKYTILDAPGHKDFVPNMIAGASQADFAILVIDANTGAYEKGLKGQTREHVLLLRSLGLQRVIVAINKLDMVGWSKDRFDEITQEVTGFLTGLGFQAKNVDFVPISGLNGENIVKKITDSAASWYEGRTLLEALEASESTAARALRKPFRMAISEIFRSQQGTTTLAGRIDAGTIQVGDVVAVQPSGETAYIKSIMVDKDSQEWSVAGQNVTMGLTDIDPIHIRIGDILCPASAPIVCGDLFTMKAMAFEHLMPMPVDLHRGRLHTPGHIQSIAATLDKATGDIIKKKPKIVQPGGVARVLIKLQEKVPLEAGQRVVIRSEGETIAAGLLE